MPIDVALVSLLLTLNRYLSIGILKKASVNSFLASIAFLKENSHLFWRATLVSIWNATMGWNRLNRMTQQKQNKVKSSKS